MYSIPVIIAATLIAFLILLGIFSALAYPFRRHSFEKVMVGLISFSLFLLLLFITTRIVLDIFFTPIS